MMEKEVYLGTKAKLKTRLMIHGHGVANAFHFGRNLVNLILEKATNFPFLSLKMPTHSLYYKRAWFLPAAGAWYKLKDLLAR